MSKNSRPKKDDWRRQGQEKYLSGEKLFVRKYRSFRPGWDHDHCEFCGAKFSKLGNDLREGFSTENGYYWVCQDCLNDFMIEFKWQIINED